MTINHNNAYNSVPWVAGKNTGTSPNLPLFAEHDAVYSPITRKLCHVHTKEIYVCFSFQIRIVQS
jgi:hypothetical protein